MSLNTSFHTFLYLAPRAAETPLCTAGTPVRVPSGAGGAGVVPGGVWAGRVMGG